MKDELFLKAWDVLEDLKSDLAGLAVRKLDARVLLSEQLCLVADALTGLQDGLLSLLAVDQDLQVRYFRRIFPEFKALQLCAQERYGLLADRPLGNVKELRKYYLAELALIERFFLRYQFHYGYFSLEASELDVLFFALEGDQQSALLPVLPLDVPDGIPVTAFLFAMFRAKEYLRAELLVLMADLEQPPVLSMTASVTEQGKLSRPFQWTSEVVHLIELAHALYLKGVVNDGKTGIMEFFDGLGEFFGVNLGVPKRGFEDLKARKRLSKTHFTDQLREALLTKMQESDAWRGSG